MAMNFYFGDDFMSNIHNSSLGVIAIVIAGLMGLYLAFFKGTTGTNEYGDDPLIYS